MEMEPSEDTSTVPESQQIMEDSVNSPSYGGQMSLKSETSLICDPAMFFDPIFNLVKGSKDQIKEKEMRTWTGRTYELIRRKAEHANRDHVDAPGFIRNRMNKHMRKVLRCFDAFPVPVDSSMIEVQDNQGRMSVAHLSAWAKQLNFKEQEDFEIDNGTDNATFVRILQNYPKNDPDYITKEEFHKMMRHYLESTEYSKMGKRKIMLNAIAYAEEVRWWPPPVFTPLVMFIEIVVFLYHFIFLTTYYNEWLTFGGPLAICSRHLFHPHRKWEWTRFFTYAFVHNGPVHLINNLLVFSFIGLPLELTNKWWRVGFVYFCGIISGSFVVSVMDSKVPLVGASGGVYALVGAHAASLLLNWKEDSCVVAQRLMKHKRTRALKTKKVRYIRLALISTLALFDTSFSVYQRYGPNCQSEVECPHTSYLAHFSGALTGLVVGILVLKNRKKEFWERIIRSVCLVLAVGFFIMGVALNIEHVGFSKLSSIDYRTHVQDNRTWDEVLPICQQAVYDDRFKNKSSCQELNWPGFNCGEWPVITTITTDNVTDNHYLEQYGKILYQLHNEPL